MFTVNHDNKLHHAVWNGDYNAVKECIENGYDVTAINENGDTALDIAAVWEEREIFQYLWNKLQNV